MRDQQIIHLTNRQISTIVSYNNELRSHVIGDEARLTGLKGKTAVFNFKSDLGEGDAEFSKKKKYWYYLAPTNKFDTRIETFTAKEATVCFLGELLKNTEVPEQIIVGEPAIRQSAWRENFRRHMREIFNELGYDTQPIFFPEPFAVFQYYRHEFLPKTSKSEVVLIIDIGGGTFNSCIVKTTDQGYLARGGATSVPLGLQAEACGGCEIDRGLLDKVIEAVRKNGIVWKDDPGSRADPKKSPVLLHIEDAKITLSKAIGQKAKVSEDQSDKKVHLHLDKGMLHPEHEIDMELTGEDLKDVIRTMWRTEYGKIIIRTINEAKKKLRGLGMDLDRLDRVLVAGGSSNLPFTKQEICTVLPTQVRRQDIHVGPHLGTSVAVGIAYECSEQSSRNPSLSVGTIAPCLLNELYLGFRKSRRSPVLLPKIRRNGNRLKNGQLLSAPFVIEDFRVSYELEMPFEVKERVFYCLSDQPFQPEKEAIFLNLNSDVFSLDTTKKIIKRWQLEIEIGRDGMVSPTFIYKEKGKGANKMGRRVECPAFKLPNFKLREGTPHLGVDFGTSNSYIVRILGEPDEFRAVEYPEFKIRQAVLDKLRLLENELIESRKAGILGRENAIRHARDQLLLMVFHSNKIEGNPLTKGETEEIISKDSSSNLSKQEKEAFNLQRAYSWMLDYLNSCFEEPEGFIRNLNKMMFEGISPEGGQYRRKAVKISGMDFTPPNSSSVPAFMERLAEELKGGIKERSVVEFAATMHTKLVWIHPFVDANGRTARLLMNAILLSNGLPAIIINYADKGRYLETLSQSNKGDISSLVDLIIECFYEALQDIRQKVLHDAKQEEESDRLQPESDTDIAEEPEMDPIDSALMEAGITGIRDPLALVMETKIERQRQVVEANYLAWKQSFAVLQSELRSIVEQFNSDTRYRNAGYRINLLEYDVLPFDKYLDITLGKKVSKTWFVGVEIIGPQSKERMLFFFERFVEKARDKKVLSPVSLVLARSDGASYRKLESEPVSLREVAYSDGQLIFSYSNDQIVTGNVRLTLKTMLAEVIKSYL